MRKAVKWFIRITSTLLTIALIVVGIGYTFISRTVPEENGVATIAGLGENIRVVRDKEAIPHIIGKSIIDVAAAQGYVHAQERLWQMETFRMAGQGRLSEIFGEKTVDTDKFLRTLNLAGHSKASFKHLKPETKEILQAYVGGINAFINRQRRMFEPELPTEFMILGHRPEPWQAWQSLLSVKVMALTLGANMSHEIRRLALASKGFNPEEIDDLVGYHATDKPPQLPDLRKIYGFPPSGKVVTAGDKSTAGNIAPIADGFDLTWPIGVTASNNWVISGSRTTSKKVLLANDPHLGLTAPSIWYLVHLSWEADGKRVNLIGASMPSIPLVMLGRNDHVAWGFTTSMLDSQDIYLERQNPENGSQYLTENGWAEFEEREEIIKISGKSDIAYKIRSTRHGPVLPMEYRNLKRYLPKRHVAALKWIAMTDDDTSVDALIGIARSSNVDTVFDTTRLLVSPMQTIVIGDSDGNIGLIAPSRVAIRSPQNIIMGRAPVPGWLPKYEWQGFLNFDQLPRYSNPANGILYSANSKFVDSDYPHHITWDWGRNYRHQRIEQLLVRTNTRHDLASMIAGQADDYSAALVRFRDEAIAQMRPGLTIDRDIVKTITDWDGHMTKDAAAPLIMMAWFKELSQAMLEDDLGNDFHLFRQGNMNTILGILRNGGSRDWCDNKKTPGQQSCSMIILEGLKKALNVLRSTYGDEWQAWRWGKAHIAHGEHRPFASVPPLDKLFNVEIESAGGPYTLLRGQTAFNDDKPFYNRHASSYRAIYDFSDLDKSLYIQTTGQSGNFLSPYYRNFAKRWADLKYLPISSKAAEYEKDAIGVWTFEPK